MGEGGEIKSCVAGLCTCNASIMNVSHAGSLSYQSSKRPDNRSSVKTTIVHVNFAFQSKRNLFMSHMENQIFRFTPSRTKVNKQQQLADPSILYIIDITHRT